MGKKSTERRVHAQEFNTGAAALALRKINKPGSSWLRAERERAPAAGNGARAFPGRGKPRDGEPARLRKENKALKGANEIHKKAAAIANLRFEAQGGPR